MRGDLSAMDILILMELIQLTPMASLAISEDSINHLEADCL